MAQSINRREFMTASAGIAAGLGLGAVSSDAQTPAAGRGGGSVPVSPLTFRTKPHKALIARPTEDDLRRMKDAGFEGGGGPRHSAGRGREDAGGRRQDRDAHSLRSLRLGRVQQSRQKRGRTNLRREPGGAPNSGGVRRGHRPAGALPDWAAAAGARAPRPRALRYGCRARGSSRSSSTPRTAT